MNRGGLAVLLGAALIVASCGRDEEASEPTTDTTDASSATSGASAPVSDGLDQGAFGDLGVVCQPGDGGATGSDPGLAAESIQISTFSDPGFTGRPGLNQELFDTAEAFTAWCNEHGGINGRQIDLKLRDAKLTEYQQRVIEACDEGDFMSVGGGAAFDDTGQADRLACALPTITAYAVSAEAARADLSIQPLPNPANELSIGSFRYLAEQFPESTAGVGLFTANIASTMTVAARYKEAMTSELGWDVVYESQYNPLGETSWRPFIEAMSSAGVRGLAYIGEPANLAKFLTEAESYGATFDWVIVDANAYDPTLTNEAGTAADGTHVRTSIHPFLTEEDVQDNVATQQYRELMERYDPDGKIAYLGVQGLSAWLLFAKAANECGDEISRDCIWENASKITEWTGGGLHATADLTGGGHSPTCWSLVVVEQGAFRVADISPTDGVFVCDETSVVELTGDYGTGATCPNPKYATDPKPSNCAV
jgi:ABC-type branched-subunit amino acid transport system substrate-binding protein